jgi:hypothetical protein
VAIAGLFVQPERVHLVLVPGCAVNGQHRLRLRAHVMPTASHLRRQMIVLYPQAIVSSVIPYNPHACWDWYVDSRSCTVPPASWRLDTDSHLSSALVSSQNQVGVHRHGVRLAGWIPDGRHQENDQRPHPALALPHIPTLSFSLTFTLCRVVAHER